ncbi:MAG TPA: DUF4124 domain-containing protein [Nevskiales bacterium]|nr:DUF4124 domain-containing protein [Nevskiales bacterium]
MLRTTGMLCLVFIAQTTAADTLYRCTAADGHTLYTDRACPGRGERIEPKDIRPNLYTGAPVAETRLESAPRAAHSTGRRGGCNNAADLRRIDLMLKSLATDARQKRFLKAERRRVQNCQLENLDAEARRRRDAALRRTGSLRESERTAAEIEIQDLYASQR